MLRLVLLYLPVLFPSWRFFQEVGPSPRVEYRVDGGDWREATGRPGRMGPGAMLRRLFWNPDWNETLFLVSCAERLVEEPTQHSMDEIHARIARRIGGAGVLEFRLVFHVRGGAMVKYQSAPVTFGERAGAGAR